MIFIYILILMEMYRVNANYFCKLDCGRRHTACIRQPCSLSYANCHTDGVMYPLNNNERRFIRDLHNKLRNDLALGKDKKINITVKNMNAISYSEELEFIAQCWTNDCIINHDECKNTVEFEDLGQNIFFLFDVDEPESISHVERIILIWYSEVEYITEDVLKSYRHENFYSNFTQMVWAETTMVGCGRTFFNEGLFFACNYGLKGNQEGLPVLAIGSPSCSICIEECNHIYKGLCGKIYHKEFFAPFQIDEGNNNYLNFYNNFVCFIFAVLQIYFQWLK